MKYQVAVRRFVLELVNRKMQSVENVSVFTGISKNTINRWRRNGILDRPQTRVAKTLTQKASPLIQALLETKCSWTHAGMCRALAQDHGVHCCKRTLFTILRNMNVSRKRVKKKKRSKNTTPETLASFKSKWIAIIEDGQDIIFQDESHFSNNILPLYS